MAVLLKSLRDESTDELVVEDIFMKEQVYQGPLMSDMPDIIFVPRPGYFSFEGTNSHQIKCSRI